MYNFQNARKFFFIINLSCFIQASKAQSAVVTYPRITGYVGAVIPIVSFSSNKPVYNFDGSFVGGLATGINIWKSAKVGFSLEFVPFVRADKAGSKMSNFLFQPGVLVALGKGWTFAGRAAFETSGRYGVTPVINKVIKRNKNSSYYVAIPLPVRFGNDHPASIGFAFQFGVAF